MYLRMLFLVPMLSLLLFGCSSGSQIRDLSHDEIVVLSTLYDYDAKRIEQGFLTKEETRLLGSYRALQDYLAEQYPNISYKVQLITPKNSNSPVGSPYDTFYIVMGE